RNHQVTRHRQGGCPLVVDGSVKKTHITRTVQIDLIKPPLIKRFTTTRYRRRTDAGTYSVPDIKMVRANRQRGRRTALAGGYRRSAAQHRTESRPQSSQHTVTTGKQHV